MGKVVTLVSGCSVQPVIFVLFLQAITPNLILIFEALYALGLEPREEPFVTLPAYQAILPFVTRLLEEIHVIVPRFVTTQYVTSVGLCLFSVVAVVCFSCLFPLWFSLSLSLEFFVCVVV